MIFHVKNHATKTAGCQSDSVRSAMRKLASAIRQVVRSKLLWLLDDKKKNQKFHKYMEEFAASLRKEAAEELGALKRKLINHHSGDQE